MNTIHSMLRGSHAFDPRTFLAPDACFCPTYTWAWNSHIDEALIRQQLCDMARAGIRGVYVLPMPGEFRPGAQDTQLDPPYLSDEFIRLSKYAAEYALSLGMQVWLYDEGGWPSGAACGQVRLADPDCAMKRLEVRPALSANGAYAPGEHCVAALDASGHAVLPGAPLPEGAQEYYWEYIPGVMLVDKMSARATELFISLTHERYAAQFGGLLGRAIPFMFTDEPNLRARAWTPGLEALFERRFGYSLLPYLPALMDDAPCSPAAAQARIDTALLRGELFEQNYLEPLRRWCAAHGMLSTGHFTNDNYCDGDWRNAFLSIPSALRHLDVPFIDAIWRQLPGPGITPPEGEPESCPFFPRLASSAASQGGVNIAGSETFAIYGAGLTGAQAVHAINYQLVRGINLFNPMSISSGRSGMLPFQMRPSYTPEMPGYTHLRALNDYTARACYLMQLGKSAARCALYMPLCDMLASQADRAAASAAYDALGRSLEARGIDFDLIDDGAVLSACIDGGALCIGDARYTSVVVPACAHMPAASRAKLSLLPHAEPVPDVIAEGACGRVLCRRRLLPDGGEAVFVFNEGDTAFDGLLRFPSAMPAYCADLRTGRIHPAARSSCGALAARLEPGEARAYLFTHSPLPASPSPAPISSPVALDGFTAHLSRRYVIDASGLGLRTYDPAPRPVSLAGWDALGFVPADFSGEVTYSARFTCTGAHPVLLDLGRVDCTAAVRVNGVPCGELAFPPYRLLLPAAALTAGENLLEIDVANTAGTACAAADMEALFPAPSIGQYHRRTRTFEQSSPVGGLYGPVTVCEVG